MHLIVEIQKRVITQYVCMINTEAGLISLASGLETGRMVPAPQQLTFKTVSLICT